MAGGREFTITHKNDDVIYKQRLIISNEVVIEQFSRPLDPSRCETSAQNELEQNYLQMFRLSVLHQIMEVKSSKVEK